MKVKDIKFRNLGNRARSTQRFTDRKKQARRLVCRRMKGSQYV